MADYMDISDVNKTMLKWAKINPNLDTKLEIIDNFPFRIRYYRFT